MSEINVPGLVREKLAPGENVVSQVRWFNAELVATDKRVLRFSKTGFESIDFKDISALKRKSSASGTIVGRIIFFILFVILVAAIVVSWLGYLDGDIAFIAAFVVTILVGFCAVFSLITVFFFKSGYQKIESEKIPANMAKYWTVGNPLFNKSRVNNFFSKLSETSGIKITEEK